MRSRRGVVALMAVAFTVLACGSVDLPEEQYYRLRIPEMRPMPTRSVQVLRIEGFSLASTLNGDRLLVSENSVQMRAYEFHRWISPLDRLVQDAVMAGLSRSQAFAEVKGAHDGPGETLTLSGRILDFHQEGDSGEWCGKVTLELRLAEVRTERVLVYEEFTQKVQMGGATPLEAVMALSRGIGMVVARFLGRCDEVGVFAETSTPGK